MKTRNWIAFGLTTAAAAAVGTLTSVSFADCTGPTIAGFFGSSSCIAPSGAAGQATGTANDPFPRTLKSFLNAVGPGDTKAQGQGFKSTGVAGCSALDNTLDGTPVVTGCSASNSVSLNVRVF